MKFTKNVGPVRKIYIFLLNRIYSCYMGSTIINSDDLGSHIYAPYARVIVARVGVADAEIMTSVQNRRIHTNSTQYCMRKVRG